jgi:dTDP-4-dehydrorhamnose 3,5-epimerase
MILRVGSIDLETTELTLPGVLLIRPRVFRDERGWFFEPYNEERYQQAGMDVRFVQDNHSCSAKGTLRGLHYQRSPGQAKLLRVTVGKVFDVIVDIRPNSKTFGNWDGIELCAETHEQLYVPVGFAHGFCVLSDFAEVLYKVSAPYDAQEEKTIAWNDPDIGVKWPIHEPVLSGRDRTGEPFTEFIKRVRS